MKIYHQGDVLLKGVTKLPEKAKKLDHKVVAHGESGNTHRFTEYANLYEYEGKGYAEVLKDTVLQHEEHKGSWILSDAGGYARIGTDFIIEKGIYEIEREREYSYEDEQLKTVVD